MADDTDDNKPLPPLPPEYAPVAIDPSFIRSPAMALWFDAPIFERAKLIAKYLSLAEGFVPPHLLRKPEACFAVVSRALAWKLDPYAVAGATYQTPNGRVGFEGKLCQAALEQSGKLEGGITFEHLGDWGKVQNKFEIKRSDKGRDYPVPSWGRVEAKGLSVKVSAQLKGEREPRVLIMDLEQCFPRNSTLWALDPKTQICYTAVRRFASLVVPGLFMGVDFDREVVDDDDHAVRAMRARDVTPPPAPTRADVRKERAETKPEPEPEPVVEDVRAEDGAEPEQTGMDLGGEPEKTDRPEAKNVTEGGKTFAIVGVPDGEVLMETEDGEEFVRLLLSEAKRYVSNKPVLDGLWDVNSSQFKFLPKVEGARVRDDWPRVQKIGTPTNPNASA